MLLGLTGCGDNNQSDTAQSNTQANTLQKAETTTAVANYNLAASPRMMGAIAPLAGWNVTKSTVLGASTLIDAAKDTKISAALITPNAKQVAEVLRGGAAGIALSIAVDQLLGAVDWVMDPANNRIVYKIEPDVKPNIPRYWAITDPFSNPNLIGYKTSQAACDIVIGKKIWASSAIVERVEIYFEDLNSYSAGCFAYDKNSNKFGSILIKYIINPNYDPKKQPEEKYLPLETVAEKVITNADAGSLDAQVATNLAAQNILNDVVQAEPVVQELENNASEKCDQNSNPSCKKECDPPAGVKFNKVTHFERHGRDPDINVGSHGCMAKTGSPVHWHYDVNHQLPDGRCFLKGHNFGGCGVAP
ncbi:hypothetical protein EA770_10330 [Acinetobacter baumannii]|nr:hypothetical protein EA770_10330 [Acinetobacter baumannii]